MIPTTRLLLLCTVLLGVLLAFSHNARAFTIRDAHQPGVVRHTYVDRLLDATQGADADDTAAAQYFNHSFRSASQPLQADHRENGYAGEGREIISVPGPGGGGTKTPDGGMTAMLLGAALGALALARRYVGH
jgi:hypothetical protein